MSEDDIAIFSLDSQNTAGGCVVGGILSEVLVIAMLDDIALQQHFGLVEI